MGRLAGRRILVTGAASGMGKGVAELFSKEGASLALLDINETRLADVASKLSSTAIACDVSDVAAVERAVSKAADVLGGIDGIVNAAGILITKPFPELDPDSWNKMIGVNLTGPYNLIRFALPHLQAADAATIVNVASVSGYYPTPGIAGYGATKGGLIMFTKGIAMDLGPKIRANTICPGVIKTEMTRYIWENPEHTERAADRTALKRLGNVEDVARAALYLSTEDSAFTTGTEIPVDGGFAWR